MVSKRRGKQEVGQSMGKSKESSLVGGTEGESKMEK